MPARKAKERSASSVAPPLPGGIKPYVAKKTETYMNKNQQDHFRAILLAWRQELIDEVSRTVHTMRDESTTTVPDPNDRASHETDISLELRSRDRERKLLKKISEAIERIDTGEYGHCLDCGVEVGIERLEARPTAELCFDCKTLAEIREKQMG